MRTLMNTAVLTPSAVSFKIHHWKSTLPSMKNMLRTEVKTMIGTTGFKLRRIITGGILEIP